MRSASSAIHEYLCSLADGTPIGTADEIAKAVQNWFSGSKEELNVTDGAVSGFLHKAQNEGSIVMVEPPDGRKRPKRFILVNVSILKAMRIKGTASGGSMPGRTVGHYTYRKGIPTLESVAQRLLDLAADVERLQPNLQLVSTDALLAELMRRQKAGAK